MGLFLLLGCSAAPFPDCCDENGERDAPFSTTYLFQYRTGGIDIVNPNPDRLLRVLSMADIMTLKNAASVSQLINNGLIGGAVQGPQGPIRELALQITDADGNVVGSVVGANRNFFYNSLGRVPDFLVDKGTGLEGTFTLFNAPPGELFFQAVRGGRGNGRITAIKAAVSLGRIDALPVFLERVGLLGVVVDALNNAPVPNATASLSATGKAFPTDSTGLFVVQAEQGPPTQGEFFFHLAAPRYWETIHRFDTGMQRVIDRQDAFDPLTADNLYIFSEADLKQMAAQAGITLDPLWGVIFGKAQLDGGTSQENTTVIPTDAAGTLLSEKGIRVIYLDKVGDVDLSLTKTTTNGGFLLFIDSRIVPAGEIFLHLYADTVSLPPARSTGRGVAHLLPGKVFVQNTDVVAVPPRADLPDGTPDPESPSITVQIEGKVQTEKSHVVEGAKITVVGIEAVPVFSGPGGKFLFEQDIVHHEAIRPLLANSLYTAQVSKAGFLTTYQELSTGPAGGHRDLTLLDTASIPTDCLGQTLGAISGTVRDLGLIEPDRVGRATGGILLKVLRPDGAAAGKVIFLDRDGKEHSTTDDGGRFIVCGLPPLPKDGVPPFYMIQVTSPEDSGTLLVEVYPNAVTLVSFEVNKALPKEVSLGGRVVDLFGPEKDEGSLHPTAVDGANIAVLGSGKKFSSGSDGRFSISLDAFSRFIFRSEKAGYLPAYNYQMESQIRSSSLPLPPAWMASKEKLSKFSETVSTPIVAGSGVIAGKVLTQGFSPGENLPVQLGQVHALYSLFSKADDNADSDLLALSSDGKVSLFRGDGRGGFSQETLNSDPGSGVSQSGNLQGGSPLETITSIQASELEDFDRDGNMDLVVIGNNKAFLFLGDIFGGFQEGRPLLLPAAAGVPSALGKADLNGDGFQDLVVAVNSSAVLVRLTNKTDGSFIAERGDPIGSCGTEPTALSVLQDVTGVTDIAIADRGRGLCVLTFNSDGTLLAPRFLETPPIKKLVSGFLNSDPFKDLVVVHEGGIGVLLGIADQGNTSNNDSGGVGQLPALALSPTSPLPGGLQPKDAVILDVNRDNRPDLILVGEGAGGGGFLLMGQGDGSFASPTRFSGPASHLGVADYDGDLNQDLILSGSTALALFRGVGVSKEGVTVAARDETGVPVGTLFYLDKNGAVLPGATSTDASGRFVFLNVPTTGTGLTMVQVTGGGSGNGMVTAYPGALSSLYIKMNSTPPNEILVKGTVINPSADALAGTPAPKVKIEPLGTDIRVLSSDQVGDDPGGLFEMALGANSEYIIKLDP
jgi:hypothetical protein